MSDSFNDHDDNADIDAPITSGRLYRRRGDLKEPEQSSSIWLISFTDVMALMLTFFVLLYSMTEPDKQTWSEVTSALQSEFNKFYASSYYTGPVDEINLARIDYDRALNINYLATIIDNIRSENENLSEARLIPQEGRLIMSLPRELLFDAGSAEVKEEGARALYTLGGAFARIKNKIEVVGHTDPRPVGENSDYDSNWDLSLARASSVAGILESVGYDRDIAIRGMSSGRYDDLADMTNEDERRAIARRVDIVILNHDGRRYNVFGD